MNIYNALIKSSLLYGSETWRHTENNKRRVEATEVDALRKSSRISRKDRIRNVTICPSSERVVATFCGTVKEIKQYQKKWLEHVQRTDRSRLPRQALKYRPEGRRNVGRPKKRWRDQVHFEDKGTGNAPNP